MLPELPVRRAFLSTPSVRRATNVQTLRKTGIVISIHALREEGDYARGIRQLTTEEFLSTPSVRRAT